MINEIPYVEQDCCLEIEGKKYCSGGSLIIQDRMIAYTAKDETGLIITTWHGEKISNARYGGRHPWGYTYVNFRYDGSWWIGRESAHGNGSIMWAKRTNDS